MAADHNEDVVATELLKVILNLALTCEAAAAASTTGNLRACIISCKGLCFDMHTRLIRTLSDVRMQKAIDNPHGCKFPPD